MNIKFDRTTLVNAFKKMSNIVGSDPLNSQASSYVRFEPNGWNGCSIVGTDNIASISINVETKEQEGFSCPFALPFGVMSKVLSKCVSDDVVFKSDVSKSDNKEWNTVMMTAGKCKTKLPSAPLSMVVEPVFESDGMKEVDVPSSELLAGIDKTSVAISEDTFSRPELRGILFETVAKGSDLSFVATNGYQLSRYGLTLNKDQWDVEFRATFPAAYTGAVVKLLSNVEGDAKLFVSDGRISIFAGDFKFTTAVNANKFPDWHRIIPNTEDYEAKFEISATELLEAIERVGSIISNIQGSFAMGAMNGLFHLSAIIPDSELHITDDLPLCYGGADVFFACNQKFFIRVLKKTTGGAVRMCLGHTSPGVDDGSFRPVMIFDENYLNLILPLRGKPSHS